MLVNAAATTRVVAHPVHPAHRALPATMANQVTTANVVPEARLVCTSMDRSQASVDARSARPVRKVTRAMLATPAARDKKDRSANQVATEMQGLDQQAKPDPRDQPPTRADPARKAPQALMPKMARKAQVDQQAQQDQQAPLDRQATKAPTLGPAAQADQAQLDRQVSQETMEHQDIQAPVEHQAAQDKMRNTANARENRELLPRIKPMNTLRFILFCIAYAADAISTAFLPIFPSRKF